MQTQKFIYNPKTSYSSFHIDSSLNETRVRQNMRQVQSSTVIAESSQARWLLWKNLLINTAKVNINARASQRRTKWWKLVLHTNCMTECISLVQYTDSAETTVMHVIRQYHHHTSKLLQNQHGHERDNLWQNKTLNLNAREYQKYLTLGQIVPWIHPTHLAVRYLPQVEHIILLHVCSELCTCMYSVSKNVVQPPVNLFGTGHCHVWQVDIQSAAANHSAVYFCLYIYYTNAQSQSCLHIIHTYLVVYYLPWIMYPTQA